MLCAEACNYPSEWIRAPRKKDGCSIFGILNPGFGIKLLARLVFSQEHAQICIFCRKKFSFSIAESMTRIDLRSTPYETQNFTEDIS